MPSYWSKPNENQSHSTFNSSNGQHEITSLQSHEDWITEDIYLTCCCNIKSELLSDKHSWGISTAMVRSDHAVSLTSNKHNAYPHSPQQHIKSHPDISVTTLKALFEHQHIKDPTRLCSVPHPAEFRNSVEWCVNILLPHRVSLSREPNNDVTVCARHLVYSSDTFQNTKQRGWS